MKRFLILLVVGVILTALSYGLTMLLGWPIELNWLEVVAVSTSFTCTLLCVYESRWNFPIGMFTTFLYTILFFQAGIPSLAIFNLYLVFSLAYGWWFWGPDEKTKPVRYATLKDIPLYIVVGLTVAGLLLGINTFFGFETTWFDLFAATMSGVAQFLLDRKVINTWVIWAVVNIVSIPLFFVQALFLVTVQYVLFLGNTIYGYFMWRKSYETDCDKNNVKPIPNIFSLLFDKMIALAGKIEYYFTETNKSK